MLEKIIIKKNRKYNPPIHCDEDLYKISVGSRYLIFLNVNNDAGTMKITLNNPSDIFIYEGTFSITNGQLTANNLNETTGNSEIYRNDISGAITISGNNLEINGNNTAYSSTSPTTTYPLVVIAEK